MFKRILVAAMLAFIPLNVSSPTEAAVQAEMSVANNQVSVQQSMQLFNDAALRSYIKNRLQAF